MLVGQVLWLRAPVLLNQATALLAGSGGNPANSILRMGKLLSKNERTDQRELYLLERPSCNVQPPVEPLQAPLPAIVREKAMWELHRGPRPRTSMAAFQSASQRQLVVLFFLVHHQQPPIRQRGPEGAHNLRTSQPAHCRTVIASKIIHQSQRGKSTPYHLRNLPKLGAGKPSPNSSGGQIRIHGAIEGSQELPFAALYNYVSFILYSF